MSSDPRDDKIAQAAKDEIARLRAAVAYCRSRLKRDAYRTSLDACLRGDWDERIRNPDTAEVVASASALGDTP